MARMGCAPGVEVTIRRVDAAGQIVREQRFEIGAFGDEDADGLYGNAEAQMAAMALRAEAALPRPLTG